MSIVESLLFTSSTVATFLAILTLMVTGQVLSPSTAFVVLSFMNLLRITLSLRLGNAIPLAFELLVSFKRIERFLLLDNMPLDPLEYDKTTCCHERTEKHKRGTYAQVLVRNPLSTTEWIAQKPISGNQETSHPVHIDEDVEKLKLRGKAVTHLSVSRLTCKLKENGNNEKYLLQDVTFEVSERSLTAITG